MLRLPSFGTEISVPRYAVAAPALLFSQHAAVALAFRAMGQPLAADAGFWLMPLRRLSMLDGLSATAAALAFVFYVAVAWWLALLSFRRANRSSLGYTLAALTVIPVVQLAAVAALAVLPVRGREERGETGEGVNVAHVVQGLLAGIAIIVLAVLVSALTFGSYGWGLFVMTPFLVGVTTGYIANRSAPLETGQTRSLVLAAAGLGGLALIALSLEGFVCILMAAPLGALVAALGGMIGREMALAGHRRGKPFLSLALLPAVFALEAAMPPALAIETNETVDIAAPPAAVWRALVSDDPIAVAPGLVGRAGLAYPLRARIEGSGVGAERLGFFSTGIARERITGWEPGRRLAFRVVAQPPAMEEMSPYRRVHAPHVQGYFDTGETRFDLVPLPGGGTRLTARASHVLRIDPVLYWEPLARWAIRSNTRRVLEDVRARSGA